MKTHPKNIPISKSCLSRRRTRDKNIKFPRILGFLRSKGSLFDLSLKNVHRFDLMPICEVVKHIKMDN